MTLEIIGGFIFCTNFRPSQQLKIQYYVYIHVPSLYLTGVMPTKETLKGLLYQSKDLTSSIFRI